MYSIISLIPNRPITTFWDHDIDDAGSYQSDEDSPYNAQGRDHGTSLPRKRHGSLAAVLRGCRPEALQLLKNELDPMYVYVI